MKKIGAFSLLVLLLAACVRAQSERLSPGDHDLSLEVDGLTRTYILHVPPSVEAGQPLPLLLVLHGGGGTGRKMQRLLGFDAYADQRGFYVAYPDAYDPAGGLRGGHWNDGRGLYRPQRRTHLAAQPRPIAPRGRLKLEPGREAFTKSLVKWVGSYVFSRIANRREFESRRNQMSELHVMFGTGTIGRAIAEELSRRGKSVRMVNRSGKLDAAPAGVELIAADLCDPAQVRAAAKGAAVVYQAAQPAYQR